MSERNESQREDKPEVVVQDFKFEPIEKHDWLQRGNEIACQSCPHPHAQSIKPGYVLRKTKEGEFTLNKEY